MNRYKLQRLRNSVSINHTLLPSFIWHCRHPQKTTSVVLNKNVQGQQVFHFLQQNNHIQAAYSELSVDYAKAQIGVKNYCGKC